MNNATELESSLGEALSFFQNLRRSLGTLETEASAQHDRLRAIASSVAALQQDWQADHQSLINLASDSSAQAGQLAELRTDSHRLDVQINTVEGLIAGIQQDQQHLRQGLTTLTTELHAQQADLRQDWQSLVEQQAGPLARIEALEQQLSAQTLELQNLQVSVQTLSQDAHVVQDNVTALETQIGQHNNQLGRLEHTVSSDQERLEQIGARADTQDQHLHQLESVLDAHNDQLKQIEQTIGSDQERLEQIGTRAETQDQQLHRLESALGTLNQTAETSAETLREQLQHLQTSIQTLNQDAHAIQANVAALETQFGQQTNQLKQLEQTVSADQERLEQIGARAETQDQHLNQVEGSLGELTQTTATSSEALREQIDEQRAQFDDLTGSLATIWQDAQALQEEVTRISSEFETRIQTFADGAQTRQDLQKQQERLKHLETLMGKVSSDTNSTRQILNVLQTDLTSQSDLLRELDQNWRNALTTYQDHPDSASNPVADSASSAGADEQIDDLANTIAALRQEFATLQQELSATHSTMTGQGERLDEIHPALQDQLHTQQERLCRVEAALANIQTSSSASDAVTIQPAFALDSHFATAAELAVLQETLTTQISALSELRDTTQQQLCAQQERLDQLAAALANASQAPAPDATVAVPTTDQQETLTAQISALNELRDTTQQQLHAQQERLDQLAAALANIQQASVPDTAATADLSTLQEALTVQAGALNDLREITQQRFGAFENQRQDFQHAANAIGDLRHEAEDLRHQMSRLFSMITQQQPASGDSPTQEVQEIRQDMEMLQQAIVELESRTAGQIHTLSGNTDQVSKLHTEVQNLQQNLVALDVLPDQLRAFHQNLGDQEQQIHYVKQTVQQLQQDSQELSVEFRSWQNQGSSAEELEARINEQREQMDGLAATLETIQSDARVNQEKVVTMATNVAKRIFEFQDKLTISETVQTERLQEAEQKIIQLQAALEILQTTLKGRSWFKMPATFTTIMLTVGTAFLGILAKVIWSIS